MKRALFLLLFLCPLLTPHIHASNDESSPQMAFTFEEEDHIKVFYEYCGDNVKVKFVFLQTQGDDDQMHNFHLKYTPPSGPPDTLLNFYHKSQINNTTGYTYLHIIKDNYPGVGLDGSKEYYYQLNPPNPAHPFNIQFVDTSYQTVSGGFVLWWFEALITNLPEQVLLNLTATGHWDADGGGGDVDYTQPFSINRLFPSTPASPTFTPGCDNVTLSWENTDDFICGNNNYKFLVFRDGVQVDEVVVTNTAVQMYSTVDNVNATSSVLSENQYSYEVQLVQIGGNASGISNPVVANPQLLPLPITDLSHSVNCDGAITLMWTNGQEYENNYISIATKHIESGIISQTPNIPLPHNASSYEDTIQTGTEKKYVINGDDGCYPWVTENTNYIGKPSGPGPINSITATEAGDRINVNWSDSQNADSYEITRQSSEGTKKIVIDGPQPPSQYEDTDIRVCISYSYKVKAINNCGSIQSGSASASISPSVNAFDPGDQELTGSKGYFPNRVRLEWDAPNDYAFDHYKLYRSSLISGVREYVDEVSKNDLNYEDLYAQAGVLYNYSLVVMHECGGNPTPIDSITDIGLRLPVANISGNIKFEGGTAVQGAEVTVERNEGNIGRSIFLNKNTYLTMHPKYSASPQDDLPLLPAMTIEMWVRPDDLSSDFALFRRTDGQSKYALLYNHTTSKLIQYVDEGGNLNRMAYSVPDFTTNSFIHLAWVKDGNTLKFYINGDSISGTPSGIVLDNISTPLRFGMNFKGNLDEIRFWDTVRTSEQIALDYKRFLRGDEDHLIAYWKIDEGTGNGVYDISGQGEMFNAHHLITSGAGFNWSTIIPNGDQLGNLGYSDASGNYSIYNIRYTGVGNTFTVVPFYSPLMTPHAFDPGTRVLFLGEGSNVQNGIDFIDVSSFSVSGTVRYTMQDSTCPAKDALLRIDDIIAQKNGLPVSVNDEGSFQIDVPIGLHRLSLQQSGHIFANDGVWPPTGDQWDFQEDLTSIKFYDDTRIKVIGRVVGGTVEASKKLGFGKSVNNLGVATITFTPQSNFCSSIVVQTDSMSGEYSVDLLPIKYDVMVDIPTNPDIDPEFYTSSVLDLSMVPSLKFQVDTMYNPGGDIVAMDTISYHMVKNFIYRSLPQVSVTNADDTPISGSDYFLYEDPGTGTTDTVSLIGLPFDVFLSGEQYDLLISAFEEYKNYDSTDIDPSIPPRVDMVPVEDGILRINNGLGNADGLPNEYEEVIELMDGDTLYTFHGGVPKLSGNYQKTLLVDLEVPGSASATWRPGDPYMAYLLGARAKPGQSFVTEGPEIVDLILRDPPGSNSFASFVEGESYSITNSWFLNTAASVGINNKIKGGTKWVIGGGLAGVGTETEVKNDIKNSLTLTASVNGSGDYTETASFSKTISTSSDPILAGGQSDLFFGKSYNYTFSATEELTLIDEYYCLPESNCIEPAISIGGRNYKFGIKDGFAVVPEGFKTTFIYSQFQIEYNIIPQLIALRNAVLLNSPEVNGMHLYTTDLSASDPRFGTNNDDPVWGTLVTDDKPHKTSLEDFSGESYTYHYDLEENPRDLVRWYNQQIRIWKEALARNEKEKIKASSDKNISFDATSQVSYEFSSSSNMTHAVTFEVGVDAQSAGALGALIAGAGNIFTFNFGLKVVTGTTVVDNQTKSNTFSYTLADNNNGDFFSVDVKQPEFVDGPVFTLRGGESMCPWEGGDTTKYYEPGTLLNIATIPRENPVIDAFPKNALNVPEHQPAVFTLLLSNESPTDDIQWYGLRVVESSNPLGAKLSIDGISPNRVFEVPPGETIEKQLKLTKSDADTYENIKLVFYSTCEYDAFQNGGKMVAIDTVTISAYFVPTCSPVNITAPNDLWVINDENNNLLPITVKNYDVGYSGFQNFQLQYKPSYSSVWKGLETFWSEIPTGESGVEIPAGSQQIVYNWELNELPDGPYDIRAVSNCLLNNYDGPVSSGIVDRIRPHAFGNPQPADGVLDPNDEILVQFNETIDQGFINIDNFDIRAVLNGTELRHNTAIALDGDNDHVEIPAGTRLGTDPLSVELWIQRLSNGAAVLVSQGDDVNSAVVIGFTGTNQLFFRQGQQTVMSDVMVTADGGWHHIAVTRNNDMQVNFYHTGEFAGTGFLDSIPPSPGDLFIGKRSWQESGHFQGYMHELRFWNSELTLGMVRSQMLVMLSGNEPGLSTLWHMDEGSGAVLHDIVRKKNATLYGDWAILPSGYAKAFSAGDRLNVSTGSMVFTRQTNFTLEFWMKTGATGVDETIISNGKGDGSDGNTAGWAITSKSNGTLSIAHGGQHFTAIQKNIRDNNWHHIALTLTRQGNLNCYLDGQLQSSLNGSAFGEFAGAFLWIGARGWFNGAVSEFDQFYNGSLDEIRIWNGFKTAEQIRLDMQYRLHGNEPGLEFYLPFEEYSDLGGIQVLMMNDNDLSQQNRAIALTGNPVFTEEDPNIKIQRPVEEINFTYSVNDDKIILTPTMDPQRIENVILQISVEGIRDLHGNTMAGPISWTAYVNKNQLHWQDSEILLEKPEKEPLQFTSKIQNSGGLELSFEILDLPDWLTASPSVGSIGPVSEKTITFQISPDVNIGDYTAVINLLSGQGFNDKLIVDMHVFGIPPDWTFDPAQFKHSMNIVADLDIFGVLSDDPLDRVVAYVDGEVRGMTTLTYLEDFDTYQAFLEVYSNAPQNVQEYITFKVWDASTGVTYGGVSLVYQNQSMLSIEYLENGLIGTPAVPARFKVTGDKIQRIPLNEGWTWISFNVLSEKFGDLDAFFSELILEDGDAVHHMSKNAIYNSSSGWGSNLASTGLMVDEMYQCNFANADILLVTGQPVDPDDYPLNIDPGWNWIPYLGKERMEVNEALSGFNPSPGDQVKSQEEFAVYHEFTPGIGTWIGTLTAMEPGKGYMLFSIAGGTLVYPSQSFYGPVTSEEHVDLTAAIQWRNGEPLQALENKARNLTMIAQIELDDPSVQPSYITAFLNGQLIGIETVVREYPQNKDLYFLTLQSDFEGTILFECYDSQGVYLGTARERVQWQADDRIGSVNEPFVLTFTKRPDLDIQVYPNPFHREVTIAYTLETASDVDLELFDLEGRLVYTEKLEHSRSGTHSYTLNGTGIHDWTLQNATYILRLSSDNTVTYQKIVKQE